MTGEPNLRLRYELLSHVRKENHPLEVTLQREIPVESMPMIHGAVQERFGAGLYQVDAAVTQAVVEAEGGPVLGRVKTGWPRTYLQGPSRIYAFPENLFRDFVWL